MIPHNLIKRVELPEGYKVLRSYFARTFDYGTIPHRSAKEAEERAQDDKLNSSLELRVVILDPTGTKTDIAVLLWKPQRKKSNTENSTQVDEVPMKTPEEVVTFHCLTEENEWEGETWYHYFLDEPEVLDILKLVLKKDDNDYTEWETMTFTWPEAERLTNLDEGYYMQKFWFGRLTNLEGLKQADSKTLYKGGIREFGEELFSYDEPESESKDENEESTHE